MIKLVELLDFQLCWPTPLVSDLWPFTLLNLLADPSNKI